MDKRAEEALNALLQSKKYREICPDTITRAFTSALGRYKSLKDADKAARSELHAISEAFISKEALDKAEAFIEKWLAGDPDSLKQALSMHASTRERLDIAEELFTRAFQTSENLNSILDLACGLNPIQLGFMGYQNVTGLDIHSGCVRLINRAAERAGWKTTAKTHDLISSIPDGEYDICLMMKLLPVMESQKTGMAKALISGVHSKYILASFPTRTLGGRGVGMEKHYSEWFESLIGGEIRILERFVIQNELVYITERKDYGGQTVRSCDSDRESE